jgi:photosystem II stability/assembly factor-like uncharacterized protein
MRALGRLLVFASSMGLCAQALPFHDVLDTPAEASRLAASGMLNGVSSAGSRLVAVGQRGSIVASDDGGATWAQANVPVSSDLTAVCFPTPDLGWAVGHDGVVLHSRDGGRNWVKQLDGIAAARLIAEQARAKERSAGASADADFFAKDGPDKPFLDVWFENGKSGYIVGAFNLIFSTHDGGATWEPLLDRTDNPKRLHLYGVRGAGQEVYIAGESGLVLRLDRTARRFVAIPVDYNGSFFGVVVKENAVIVFGMRGNAFRTRDAGRTWTKLATGTVSTLNGGAVLADGRLVLVSQGGQALLSADDGDSFVESPVKPPLPIAAVAAVGTAPRALALAGLRGVRVQAIP